MRTACLLLAVLVAFCFTHPAIACAWDRDTLAMEKARFPDAVELIAGYFPRHSEAYYQWRNNQVRAIPVAQRTPADYDDLGVGYDKLGEHQKAIDTMLAKAERFSNKSLYQTHANLGTFYIHNGDFEQGVQYIGSAIEINPEAHFGREVYQKLLVEYILQQHAAGNTLPLEPEMTDPFPRPQGSGFASYVIAQQKVSGDEQQAIRDELDRTVKGVLGMMRFGNHDSPVLLEALGDLLQAQRLSAGVQRLAVRAYLKASYEAEDSAAAETYRAKAESAVGNQQNETLASIESELKREIEKGDAFFAQIKEDEQAWAEAGADLDAKFQAKYYEQPRLSQPFFSRLASNLRGMPAPMLAGVVLISALSLYLIAVLIRLRRNRLARPGTAT